MSKIMIVSDSADTSSEIRFAIERNMKHQVIQVFNRVDMKKQLESSVFNVMILDCPMADERTIERITWLRAAGCIFPIMVISEKVHQRYNERLTSFDDVHVLLRPVYDKNILGLVRKLLATRRVPKQVFRRYNTNQIAEIEGMSSKHSLLTSMYNLSQGGAYLEFEQGDNVSVGDLYIVKVAIENSTHHYTFNAKVVWTTSQGRFSGRFGCGLKFVTPKEIHHKLLMRSS